MRSTGRRGWFAIVLAAAILLAGLAVVPAHGIPAASYKPQFLESPAYALDDHTGFGVRWAALAGSGLPGGQYYVKLVVTDTADPVSATVTRGFNWNETTQEWIAPDAPISSYQTVTAASDGAVGNDWVYAKIGDEDLPAGDYYVQVVLVSVADGTTYYANPVADLGDGVKVLTVLDPETNGVWLHNAVDRSMTYSDSDVSGKRVTVFTSDSTADPNFPPTAPVPPITMLSLWECQYNLIDDDANGIVDDEAYGPSDRTIGDFRISAPISNLVDVWVNRNQTSKGGFKVDNLSTGAVADADIAIDPLGGNEMTPPAAPTGLAAAMMADSANLSWTAATDSGGSELAGYYVYRWQDSGSELCTQPHLRIATLAADATSFTDTGLTYGQTYRYEVRAFDGATNVGPRSDTASVTVATPAYLPVHRFYNLRTRTHFYTADETERARIASTMASLFSYDGVAYLVDPWQNAQPLYRFYNARTGAHFFTATDAEKNAVMANLPGFSYEGVAYNVSLAGGTPVYRFYNPGAGVHFYTADSAERDRVISQLGNIYSYEGIGYYLGQAD